MEPSNLHLSGGAYYKDMRKLEVQGAPGHLLSRRNVTIGRHYRAEYRNGTALEVNVSLHDPVKLRASKDGDFVEIENCYRGFTPQEDWDPVDIYKGGTRQLIHPDGTIDILYGRFATYPSWPGGREWVGELSFYGHEPGKLPAGLSESPDGTAILLPDGIRRLKRIPLPVSSRHFCVPEPSNIETAEMVEAIRARMQPLPAKLMPITSFGPPLDD